ncbi:MAG: hypothetical protein HeimC3_43480 [Candidatus Heimdallarchaeota archaeon LC_3]|nr:MAG: hypothetical protein HeimC3_43480 [Candidatus Heimdallarchaeota archaeon LC_3]
MFSNYGKLMILFLSNDFNLAENINGYISLISVFGGVILILLGFVTMILIDNQEKKIIVNRVIQRIRKRKTKDFTEINPVDVYQRPIDHGPINRKPRPEPEPKPAILGHLESEKEKTHGLTPTQWKELQQQGFSQEEAVTKVNLERQKEIYSKISKIEQDLEEKNRIKEEKKKIEEDRIRANLPPEKRSPDQTLTPSEWKLLKSKGLTREQAIKFKKSGKSLEDAESSS